MKTMHVSGVYGTDQYKNDKLFIFSAPKECVSKRVHAAFAHPMVEERGTCVILVLVFISCQLWWWYTLGGQSVLIANTDHFSISFTSLLASLTKYMALLPSCLGKIVSCIILLLTACILTN